MMNLKKLNLFLLALLLMMIAMVFVKYTRSKDVRGNAHQITQSSEAKTVSTPKPQKEMSPSPEEKEQLRKQYELVKYKQLITAIRSHHSRDLNRVVSEGLDFDALPEGSKDELRQVAQEEDFLSLVAPLFEK